MSTRPCWIILVTSVALAGATPVLFAQDYGPDGGLPEGPPPGGGPPPEGGPPPGGSRGGPGGPGGPGDFQGGPGGFQGGPPPGGPRRGGGGGWQPRQGWGPGNGGEGGPGPGLAGQGGGGWQGPGRPHGGPPPGPDGRGGGSGPGFGPPAGGPGYPANGDDGIPPEQRAAGGFPAGPMAGGGGSSYGLSPELDREAREFLKQWNPQQLVAIEQLQLRNPGAIHEIMRSVLTRKQELMRIKTETPDRYALLEKERDVGIKAAELSAKLAKATPAERTTAEAELRKVLEEQFDLKLKAHQMEADQLEKDLAELRARLKKRADSKKDIVERRLHQLAGDQDLMDW